jgi:hypothetical protein
VITLNLTHEQFEDLEQALIDAMLHNQYMQSNSPQHSKRAAYTLAKDAAKELLTTIRLQAVEAKL